MPRLKIDRAMDLALAARCAYPECREQIDELELDSWESFTRGPVEGFVGSTGKKTILAFRGNTFTQGPHDTLTWLDKALTEWSSTLDLQPRQYHSGKVHGGCLEALQAIWPEITRLLREHGTKDKNLWITGHSLGGGLAALAGAMVRWENDLEAAGVYTFGSPLIADAAFAANYPAPLFRFENRNDLIPHLPPDGQVIKVLRMLSTDIEEALNRWFGPDFPSTTLAAIGELHYINARAKLVDHVDARERLLGLAAAILFDVPQLLQDHWIDSYCAAIDAAS